MYHYVIVLNTFAFKVEYFHEMETKVTHIQQSIPANTNIADNCNSDDMSVLLNKVKKDHVLTLVEEENESAKKKEEKNKRAIFITDPPDLPKLTRSKVKQLKKDPIPKVPVPVPEEKLEFVSLIQDEFHSDEDDEEYIFREEDFISDEDHNTSISDLDSQPPTPKSPQNFIRTDIDNSSNLLSPDGCFKLPRSINDKKSNDLRIATRTRSKLCLEKTTIEDLQSEFIPPDVETGEIQHFDTSDIWTEFLNEFSRPLNSNFIGEDDEVNDPEYVGNENVPLDAEELKNVNISKKELNDLVASLFEDLLSDAVTVEGFDFTTANDNKFSHTFESTTQTPSLSTPNKQGSKGNTIENICATTDNRIDFLTISDSTISSSNITEIISQSCTEGTSCVFDTVVHDSIQKLQNDETPNFSNNSTFISDVSFNNSLWENFENTTIDETYEKRFGNLENKNLIKPTYSTQNTGFTEFQYQIFQQQLRIHIQFLTQNFFQTHRHPAFSKLSSFFKDMMYELTERAKRNSAVNAWNLFEAQKLINEWDFELSQDTPENRDLINFFNKEIMKSNRYSKAIAHLPNRIMERMIESSVFMYPEYLPRVAFRYRIKAQHNHTVLAPSESILIAMGLEYHLNQMRDEKLNSKGSLVAIACGRIAKTTIFGKTKTRVYKFVKKMLEVPYFNPIKYYFKYKCAPPVHHRVIYFDSKNIQPLKMRDLSEMPPFWRSIVKSQQQKRICKEIGIDVAEPFANKTSKVAHQNTEEKNSNHECLPENIVFEVSDDFQNELMPSKPKQIPKNESNRKIGNNISVLQPESVNISVNYTFRLESETNPLRPTKGASISQNKFLEAMHNEHSPNWVQNKKNQRRVTDFFSAKNNCNCSTVFYEPKGIRKCNEKQISIGSDGKNYKFGIEKYRKCCTCIHRNCDAALEQENKKGDACGDAKLLLQNSPSGLNSLRDKKKSSVIESCELNFAAANENPCVLIASDQELKHHQSKKNRYLAKCNKTDDKEFFGGATDHGKKSVPELQSDETPPFTSSALSAIVPWNPPEDKIILIEMKINSKSTENLIEQLMLKLPNRSRKEITDRHQFLIDFLSKL